MAELEDAVDSKSTGGKPHEGSTPSFGTIINKMNLKERIKEEVQILTNLIDEALSGKEKNEEKLNTLVTLQGIIRGINQLLLRIKNKSELLQEIVNLVTIQPNIIGSFIKILEVNEIKTYSNFKEENLIKEILTSKEIELFEPYYSGEIKKFEINNHKNISVVSIPISDEKGRVGVFVLFSNKRGFFDKEEMDYLKEVTSDILVGLRTINYENRIKDSLLNLARGITKIVELRDPSAKGHGETVAKLSYEIGKNLGFDEERLDMLYIAALIHDIGKISIAIEILNKPFKLRDVEYEWVKQHTYYGYEYLKDLNFPIQIPEIILQHHERVDGSGYPKGLKGDEIMIEAKIIGVAEVFHAMISNKPYRPAHSIEEALDYIKTNRGVLFDENVVDKFFEVINEDFQINDKN